MPVTAIEALRVLLAALVFLAPGILLVRPAFGRNAPSGVLRLALGAGLGLGAYGLFLWINTHLGLPLTLWIGVWVALVAVALVVAWAAGRRRRPASPIRPAVDFSGTPGRILLALCLGSALLAPSLGSYAGASADAWDYLNRATAILRADRLDAPNPYSPGLHNPYDPTFYGVIASISRLSGVSPARVWPVIPILATPMEIGVMAVTVAVIVGSPGVGAAAAVIYTLLYGPFFLFRNSGHHQMLGDVLFLICLAGLFLYWRHAEKRHLVLGALAAVAGVALHHFILVQAAFGVGGAGLCLFLASRRFPGRARRAIVYVATVGLTLLPVAILVQLEYVSQIDLKAMNRQFAEMVSPLLHFGPLYMPDPFPWFFRSFWRPLPALLLLVYFGRRWRDPRLSALGVLLLAPVLIVLNPLVFPLVAGLAGLQVSTRLLNLTAYPSVMLLGWALFEFISGRAVAAEPELDEPAGGGPAGTGLSRPAISRPLALACIGLSIAPILVQALIRIQGDYLPGALERERANSPAAWSGALDELARRVKPGDMVLSDFVTAYSIPSFAPVSIVANFREDFAYQTADFGRRLQAIDVVLGPLAPPDSTLAALAAYDVEWIVVNSRITNPLAVDKLDMMSDLGSGIRREFERDGLHVYSVAQGRPEIAPVSHEALLERLLIAPATFQSFKEPGTGLVFDGAAGIGAVLGPDSAAVGDTVYVTLYYQWRDEPPRGNLYPKLLRDAAYGTKGQWFTRQIRNSVLGRYDSMLFARDLEYRSFRSRPLPPGTVFADMFEIPVTRGVVPGRYGLYVREGDYPTDANTGMRLGEVEIVTAP